MDRIDRRGFLECMAWAGTGVVWAATGGVMSSRLITEASAADAAAGSFTFVQISDTHIGFKGEANKDPAASLQQLVDRVNARRPAPAFVLHTGDQTHGQKAGAFDTVTEILKTVKTERIKEDADYAGVRVTFRTTLHNSRIAMQIDVGFGDVLTPAAVATDCMRSTRSPASSNSPGKRWMPCAQDSKRTLRSHRQCARHSNSTMRPSRITGAVTFRRSPSIASRSANPMPQMRIRGRTAR